MEVTLHEMGSRAGRTGQRPPTRLLWIPPAAQPAPDVPVCLSVIVPTLNERKNLPELLHRLTPALESSVGAAWEIIVVDDDSPDRTWDMARRLAERHPRLRVIRRTGEKGLSTAVIRGWQAARGEVLGVLDGDLQHPPEILASLWHAIEHGADLAVGSRHAVGGDIEKWGALRRLLSFGARLLALLLLPSAARRLTDPTSGCFLVRRTSVAGKRLSPLGYKILLEVLVRGAIHTIHEVGFVFQERRRGAGKVTARTCAEYLAHLVRLRVTSEDFARFSRFATAGLLGVGIDMALLFALADPRALGLDLTLGKIAAAEVALVHNFFWNDALAFRDVASESPGLSNKVARLLRFNAVCGTGILISAALLHAQMVWLGMDRYVANAAAIAVVALWNYHLVVKVGWAAPRREETGSRAAAPSRAA